MLYPILSNDFFARYRPVSTFHQRKGSIRSENPRKGHCSDHFDA